MITVGAFEAKTTLSALLERVAAGEEVLITKHGRALARIVPAVGVEQGWRGEGCDCSDPPGGARGRRLRGLSVRQDAR